MGERASEPWFGVLPAVNISPRVSFLPVYLHTHNVGDNFSGFRSCAGVSATQTVQPALTSRIKLVWAAACVTVWTDMVPQANLPLPPLSGRSGVNKCILEVLSGTDSELCGHPPSMIYVTYIRHLEILVD